MVYINQEVVWSAKIPCMGLGWARIGSQGQIIQNLVPWDQKILLKNFFTQSKEGTLTLFCGVLKTRQFFGLNRLATYTFQILHYQLGKKLKLILQHQKVIYVNGQVKRKLLELFLGQKMMSWGPLGAQMGPQGPTGGQKIVATSKNL